ncbi:zinc/manganese transport system ATP-binding protein [Marinospirillum celere]|uniref:Zinc/manganese transport system ATP-binding protein n=1 Tax=Marinospirillum celere TaxID=1122252 RepID=A0A1I1I5Y2_9GAMM|nr:metal ABC transporter ATP-binding protein [Marinospirillum celere]SFC31425.1 zinc/manganese transport system ATP-binding protein [Marinospirillum celere]
MQTPQALLSFENLTLGYERHPAVHHLQGTLFKGDLMAVVGPNGAGKSTLLKGLMNELRPLGGKIRWVEKRPSLAYLPQRSGLNLDFPLRVSDFVSLGHWPRLGAFASVGRKQRQAVGHALAQVGMQGFEKRSLDSLSGGQLQRILFARLLLEDAQLLLLDEPFSAVDEQTTADLLKLIHQWNQEGRTILTVLHDLRQVRQHFPKCLLLARDAVALGPTPEVLTDDNLAKARNMQAPFDPLAPVCEADLEEAR